MTRSYHYKTPDGEAHYSATSPEDLVSQMHRGSRSPAASDQDWMDQAADRLADATDVLIRTQSAVAFVEDLLSAGLLVQLDEQPGPRGPQKG
jgi:hypothetical protein